MFFLICQYTYCQSVSELDKNAVFYEVLGHSRSSIFSFHYERVLLSFDEHMFILNRVGVGIESGYVENGKRYNQRTTIPNVMLLLIGKKPNYFQFGIGYSATFTRGLLDNSSTPVQIFPRYDSAYSLSIGYRYMDNGAFVAAYPLILKNKGDSKLDPNFGLSIGLTW